MLVCVMENVFEYIKTLPKEEQWKILSDPCGLISLDKKLKTPVQEETQTSLKKDS